MEVIVFKYPTKNQRIGKVFIVKNIVEIAGKRYNLLWHTGELKEPKVFDIFDVLDYYDIVIVHTGMSGCSDFALYHFEESKEGFVRKYNEEKQSKVPRTFNDIPYEYIKKNKKVYAVFHETMSGYFVLPPLLLTEEETKSIIELFSKHAVPETTEDEFAQMRFNKPLTRALKALCRTSSIVRTHFEEIIKELRFPELFFFWTWMRERYNIWLTETIGLTVSSGDNFAVFHFGIGNPETEIKMKLPKIRKRNIKVFRARNENVILTPKFMVMHKTYKDKDVVYITDDGIVHCLERYREYIHAPAIISAEFLDQYRYLLLDYRLGDLLFIEVPEISEEVLKAEVVQKTEDASLEHLEKLQILNGEIKQESSAIFITAKDIELPDIVLYHPEHGMLELRSFNEDNEGNKVPAVYVVRRVPYIRAGHD